MVLEWKERICRFSNWLVVVINVSNTEPMMMMSHSKKFLYPRPPVHKREKIWQLVANGEEGMLWERS